jgi:cell division protein FtsB
MSASMAIPKTSLLQRARSWKVDRRTAAGAMFILTLLSLIGWLYLTQASYVTVTSYHLAALRAERDELRRQNAQLTYEISRLTTRNQVQARARQLGFAPVSQVRYLAVADYPASKQLAAARNLTADISRIPDDENWWEALVAQLGAWWASPLSLFQARASP